MVKSALAQRTLEEKHGNREYIFTIQVYAA